MGVAAVATGAVVSTGDAVPLGEFSLAAGRAVGREPDVTPPPLQLMRTKANMGTAQRMSIGTTK